MYIVRLIHSAYRRLKSSKLGPTHRLAKGEIPGEITLLSLHGATAQRPVSQRRRPTRPT